ncbi:hypothetical protein H310_11219 [Aphanomyces invadans]|uniref:Nucleotide-diphospho-sugar transferase domain-containing protein n=1 Tax=Aphanomyces invadans TaxID=157072 RepID=A0A024TPQ2_9STRA|nr:hypothetical protein H310_11219 [Aphanomyces invadans]ETV95322.1 hypothetical protein H310_11219 [Aphanomyces invadans]|eukprot:XP_008876023.1 hypothetical protein H310_11219 [Aphanomyces invadans]
MAQTSTENSVPSGMADRPAELDPMLAVSLPSSPGVGRQINIKYVATIVILVIIVLNVLFLDSFAVVLSQGKSHVSPIGLEAQLANTTLLVDSHGNRLRLAYMLYATDARTVCNAIILASNIRKLGTPASIPIVTLVGNDVPPSVIQRLTDANIVAIPIDPWKQERVDQSDEWFRSLTKLRIFEERGYDKVIYLDSDVWVHRNLDHLFFLGDAVLWAPHAYYIKENYVFGSTLLVFTPSNAVFHEIQDAMAHPPRPNYFDMDVLNDLYKLHCGFLPNNYVVLTYTLHDNANWSFASKADRIHKTYVHHFSPDGTFGKPWNMARSEVYNRRGSIDSVFYNLYTMYWEHEDCLCAWLKQDKSDP